MYALVNMPHRGRTYLGVGQRPPIMANGQTPGIRRRYDTRYMNVLQRQYDRVYERVGSTILGVGAGLVREGFTFHRDPSFNLSAVAAHHLAQQWEPAL